MKTQLVRISVFLLASLLGAAVQAEGKDMVFVCTGADGTLLLSSVATGRQCEKVRVTTLNPSPEEVKQYSRAAEPVSAASAQAVAETPSLESCLARYLETRQREAAKPKMLPPPTSGI